MLFSDKLITKFNWWCNIIVLVECLVELYILCYDHSVNSTDLTALCSRFLFLSVHGPKISTALERIAQIYLPLFASLLGGFQKSLGYLKTLL